LSRVGQPFQAEFVRWILYTATNARQNRRLSENNEKNRKDGNGMRINSTVNTVVGLKRMGKESVRGARNK